jgi:hypothetical protein
VTKENPETTSDRLANFWVSHTNRSSSCFSRTKPPGRSDSKRRAAVASPRTSSPPRRAKPVAYRRKLDRVPVFGLLSGLRGVDLPGIEYFLSHGPAPGRECERFVKTPELAREYVAFVQERRDAARGRGGLQARAELRRRQRAVA